MCPRIVPNRQTVFPCAGVLEARVALTLSTGMSRVRMKASLSKECRCFLKPEVSPRQSQAVRHPYRESTSLAVTVVAAARYGLSITFGSARACCNIGAPYTMTSATVGKACTVTMSRAGNRNYTAVPEIIEITTVRRSFSLR